MFQFHKGTIKTLLDSLCPINIETFQFHKGTIKTEFLPSWAVCLLGFQFHKGTIKTHYDSMKSAKNSCFNSIKVRLKRRGVAPRCRSAGVSIP